MLDTIKGSLKYVFFCDFEYKLLMKEIIQHTNLVTLIIGLKIVNSFRVMNLMNVDLTYL